jgi:hypothetical protein
MGPRFVLRVSVPAAAAGALELAAGEEEEEEAVLPEEQPARRTVPAPMAKTIQGTERRDV